MGARMDEHVHRLGELGLLDEIVGPPVAPSGRISSRPGFYRAGMLPQGSALALGPRRHLGAGQSPAGANQEAATRAVPPFAAEGYDPRVRRRKPD
jgi:hypothetical protein